jgi:D-beta-D-heptose 7-phosphate kinase/D-beta-D-heptose 1-phosphate adenosyltransferase
MSSIIFSDYNKGVLTQYVCEELIAYAGANNIYTFVDPKPSGAIKYMNCFCFKLNLLEAETISGKTSKHDIIRYLKEYIQCDHIILTCGEHGLYVDSIEHHITGSNPIDVIDVTGCGDIVLAVSAYIYLKTLDILRAGKLANHVARKCVSNIGNHQISAIDVNDFIDSIIYDHETTKLDAISKMGRTLVFTNGCFDIVHSAHIQLLQFAKKLGDILIVGINSDASVRRLKGESRPINHVIERCRLLQHLGIIDYIVVFSDDTPLNILRVLRPSIIVKGGDYAKENIVGAEYAKEIVIYDYVAGISSTNTIAKISRREERAS